MDSAETDETGFGGFVTMLLGHFLKKIDLISGQPDKLLFYFWITESAACCNDELLSLRCRGRPLFLGSV